MDFAIITHLYALDAVGEFTFGKPYGFLDDCEDLFGYLKWNEDFFPSAMTFSTLPFLSKIFQTGPFAERI
jgi:hypothetical protein